MRDGFFWKKRAETKAGVRVDRKTRGNKGILAPCQFRKADEMAGGKAEKKKFRHEAKIRAILCMQTSSKHGDKKCNGYG